MRKWRAEHKEHIKEYRKRWDKVNAERLEYRKLYRIRNKQRATEYRKLYRLRNKLLVVS